MRVERYTYHARAGEIMQRQKMCTDTHIKRTRFAAARAVDCVTMHIRR